MPGTPKPPDSIALEPVPLAGSGYGGGPGGLASTLRDKWNRIVDPYGRPVATEGQAGGGHPLIYWSEGLVAWEKTVWVSAKVNPEAPVLALELAGGYDCAQTMGPDYFVPASLCTARLNLRMLVPPSELPAPFVLDFQVNAGFGCSADEVFRGTFTPGGKASGCASLVQVSGLLSNRWQILLRVVEEVATSDTVEFALNVMLDRVAGGFQLRWPDDGTVAKTFPAGAPLSNINVLP